MSSIQALTHLLPNSLKLKLERHLRDENNRSRNILKNIFLSFWVKGGSILVGLILIPMTIDYISPIQYGIWLTISSIISWMSFFDIGLGNGLRNKLTNAIAHNNYVDAKIYVSTTYGILTIISLCLFVFFCILNPFISWNTFLNVPSSVHDNLSQIILIVLLSFCIQFVVQIINVVLTATHQPAMAGLLNLLGQIGILLVILILKYTVPGSLGVLVWVLALIPILVLLIGNFYFYSGKLSNIAPSLKAINFGYAKSILNVGGIFFFIQIGAIVLLQSNNIIISKVIGPSAVTEFNIAYRLFSVLTMAFTIIITPYWSGFTDAYAKEDFTWMKITLFRIRKIWVIMSLVIIPIIIFLSDNIYKFWVGINVHVPVSLSISMGFYVIGYTGMMLNCYFLNGIGKLRLQLLLYIAVCIINIPLSTYLGRLYGTSGVAVSSVCIFGVMGVILWIQSSKIINQKAFGLWNK